MARIDLKPLRIAVLAGGDSAEREISLASCAQVIAALQSAGHFPAQIDPRQTRLEDVPWAQHDLAFIALHGGAGEDGRIQQQLEQLKVIYTGSGPEACRLAMDKMAA